MKHPQLEAVVFDVDGMLLNTQEFIFRAYEYTLADAGHPVPSREFMSKQIGRSLQECYLAFAPNGDIDALCLACDRLQNTPEMIGLITAYPGVPEMLQQLKEANIKLGVFSSRKLTLVSSLAQAGIADYFEVIVQGDEVKHHKPHPEGLFKALKALDVTAAHAAMIGDAAVDIEAGKAASVGLTIGITYGFGTQEELEAAKPDYLVHSAAEIAPILLGHS